MVKFDYLFDGMGMYVCVCFDSGWNSCSVNNGGCSDLCVARGYDNSSHHTHQCSCPTHYTLAADNRTCIRKCITTVKYLCILQLGVNCWHMGRFNIMQ